MDLIPRQTYFNPLTIPAPRRPRFIANTAPAFLIVEGDPGSGEGGGGSTGGIPVNHPMFSAPASPVAPTAPVVPVGMTGTGGGDPFGSDPTAPPAGSGPAPAPPGTFGNPPSGPPTMDPTAPAMPPMPPMPGGMTGTAPMVPMGTAPGAVPIPQTTGDVPPGPASAGTDNNALLAALLAAYENSFGGTMDMGSSGFPPTYATDTGTTPTDTSTVDMTDTTLAGGNPWVGRAIFAAILVAVAFFAYKWYKKHKAGGAK